MFAHGLSVISTTGVEGDKTRQARRARPQAVSNPLRLEGDRLDRLGEFRGRMFLIHYGWRGTLIYAKPVKPVWRVSNPLRVEGDGGFVRTLTGKNQFLIHYGWRGTMQEVEKSRGGRFVSNPLRLEGDGAPRSARNRPCCVSNPLRLEGDPSRVPAGYMAHRRF